MATPTTVLLKLALHAVERGDVESAREALTGVLAMGQSNDATSAPTARLLAVRAKTFAAMIEVTPKHVHALIARRHVVTIGNGRGLRILVDESLQRLRDVETGSVASAGEKYIRGRKRLSVVKGGAP
jgi:hypothetical protein